MRILILSHPFPIPRRSSSPISSAWSKSSRRPPGAPFRDGTRCRGSRRATPATGSVSAVPAASPFRAGCCTRRRAGPSSRRCDGPSKGRSTISCGVISRSRTEHRPAPPGQHPRAPRSAALPAARSPTHPGTQTRCGPSRTARTRWEGARRVAIRPGGGGRPGATALRFPRPALLNPPQPSKPNVLSRGMLGRVGEPPWPRNPPSRARSSPR